MEWKVKGIWIAVVISKGFLILSLVIYIVFFVDLKEACEETFNNNQNAVNEYKKLQEKEEKME